MALRIRRLHTTLAPRLLAVTGFLVIALSCQDYAAKTLLPVQPSLAVESSAGGGGPACPGLPAGTSSLSVVPGATSIVVGATVDLDVKTQSGALVPDCALKWSSLDTSVAKVTNTGLVFGVKKGGPVTIRAKSSGKKPLTGTAFVTVVAPVASVTVSPPSATLPVGQSLQLSTTLKDADGRTVTGRIVTWSSGNASVATVSSSGLVMAVGPGSATISAASEGKSGASEVTVPPVVDIVSGLLAYFPFSGNALDASGNNQHGTPGAGAYLVPDRAGVPDAAYGFTGDEGLIDIGQIDLTGAFTLAAWIRPDVQAVGGVISKFNHNAQEGYELLYAGEQQQHCMRLHTSGVRGTAGFDCGTPLQLGTWYHVVGTYDGSSVGKLYLNGVLVAQLGGLLPDTPGSLHTLIGRSAWGAQTFQGRIDEVRIYGRALSAADVAFLAVQP